MFPPIILDPPAKFLTFWPDSDASELYSSFFPSNRSQLFRFRFWYFMPEPNAALYFIVHHTEDFETSIFPSRVGNWQFQEFEMKVLQDFSVVIRCDSSFTIRIME
jgi:hypothetical protein